MLNNLTNRTSTRASCSSSRASTGPERRRSSALLAKWLSADGHRVFVTEWNSSALVKAATKTGKKKNALTPMTFSLLHATDFADRLLYKIIPPLKAGMIVLADRYAYTAFARDVARGVDRRWVRDLYSFAVRPDLALYFRVPIDVSLDRLIARRVKLKFYEAGMDMGWSTNPTESFRIFQGKVLDEYDRIVDEFGLRSSTRPAASPSSSAACDASCPDISQRDNPETGDHRLNRLVRTARPPDRRRGANGGMQPGRYYGRGLPVPADRQLPRARSSRSRAPTASAARRRSACCGNGSRSGVTASSRPAGRAPQLMQPTIDLAKSSNTLNKLTFVLLYATDFADRLEKEIIPASRPASSCSRIATSLPRWPARASAASIGRGCAASTVSPSRRISSSISASTWTP